MRTTRAGLVRAAAVAGAIGLSCAATLTSGPTTSARAAGSAFACTAGTIENLAQNGAVYDLATSGAANTAKTTFSGSSNLNALAITADGSAAYGVEHDTSSTIRKVDPTTGTTTTFTGSTLPNVAGGVVMGAIDPTTGIYYYAGPVIVIDPGDYPNGFLEVAAFDTSTDQSIGLVGRIPLRNGSDLNGDFAFDAKGDLYVVEGSTGSDPQDTTSSLEYVPGPLPTTAGAPDQPLASTQITALPTQHDGTTYYQYDGIAFDAAGTLYAQYVVGPAPFADHLVTLDPDNGQVLGNVAESDVPTTQALTDLASCTYPGRVQLRVDVEGRVDPADQFGLDLTQGKHFTATTTGSTTGVQTGSGEIAGPVPGVGGDVYGLGIDVASGPSSIADYTTSVACVNAATGAAVATSGTPPSATVAMPGASGSGGQDVVCTYTVAPAPSSSVSITKAVTSITGPSADGAISAVGQVVHYGFTVTDTGGTPLTDVAVADVPDTTESTMAVDCGGGSATIASLGVGDDVTCTGSYTVAQADLDRGHVSDTATAAGTDPSGAAVRAVSDEVTVPVDALTITKAVGSITDPAETGAVSHVGQHVAYAFTVDNTGTQDLTDVVVTDIPDSTESTMAVDCGGGSATIATLAAGGEATCSASYAVTQADLDRGAIADTATAAGADPEENAVDATSNRVSVPVLTDGLSISKAVTAITDPSSTSSVSVVGQHIAYAFTVSNTGDQDLSDVAVTDVPDSTESTMTVDCGGGSATIASLAHGASATCTATYTVAQADLDRGHVTDTATAAGTDPQDVAVDATSNQVSVPVTSTPTTTTSAPTTTTSAPTTTTSAPTTTTSAPTTTTSAPTTTTSAPTTTSSAPTTSTTSAAPSSTTASSSVAASSSSAVAPASSSAPPADPGGGALPFTGATAIRDLLLLAALLIGGGALLVSSARRPPRRH